MTDKQREGFKSLGARAAREGQGVDSFYDICIKTPRGAHWSHLRALFEIGYRTAKKQEAHEMKKGDKVRDGYGNEYTVTEVRGTTVYVDRYVGLGQNWLHITKVTKV